MAHQIRDHYKKIGIPAKWNRERFMRMCQIGSYRPEEIGAMILLRPSELKTMLHNDKFSGPVALHLAIIEGVILAVRLGQERKNIIPMNLLSKVKP